MPSRAELFCLQHSVSKHVIAFTVNVSIQVDQVARCEGKECWDVSTVVCLETRCADNNRLEKLISDFGGYPAAHSDILPSNTT